MMGGAKTRCRRIALFIVACTLNMGSAALANITDHVVLGRKATVLTQNVQQGSGIQQFLVASNAPYSVHISGVIGNVSIQVENTGSLNGVEFGERAYQQPTEIICRNLQSFQSNQIYFSQQKTAASRGSLRQQSSLITIRFSKIASPDVRVSVQENEDVIPEIAASGCGQEGLVPN